MASGWRHCPRRFVQHFAVRSPCRQTVESHVRSRAFTLAGQNVKVWRDFADTEFKIRIACAANRDWQSRIGRHQSRRHNTVIAQLLDDWFEDAVPKTPVPAERG